jgi:Ca2+-transporting ATPase
LQGLVITVGALAIYQYAVYTGLNEDNTRSMVFTVLIAANIVLTLVNRSFYFSVLKTLRYKNNLVLLIIGITIVITALLLYVPILAGFFKFEPLSLAQLGVSIAAGFISVIWYELVKVVKRSRGEA